MNTIELKLKEINIPTRRLVPLAIKKEVAISPDYINALFKRYRKLAPSRFRDADMLTPKPYIDCYEQSEYFSSINEFRFSSQTITNTLNGDIPLRVNAYMRKDKAWRHEIPIFEINQCHSFNIKKGICKYSVIKKQIYIPAKPDDVNQKAVLFTDVPYCFYSTIQNLDNFFYYDLDNKCIATTGTLEQKTKELIDDIRENGIKDPLFMQIKNGTIVSTNDSYGRLFAAKALRLPSIPARITMTNEMHNEFEQFLKPMNKDMANKICNPYFVFF